MAALLLYHEAQIDSLNTKLQTPLILACELGFDEIVSLLINAGADINSQDMNRNTGLHLATINKKQKTIDLLLNRPSLNLKLKNKDGRSAIDYSQNPNQFQKALMQQEKNSITIYDARTEAGSESMQNLGPNKVGPSHFKVHALIGRGSFGEVYLVE